MFSTNCSTTCHFAYHETLSMQKWHRCDVMVNSSRISYLKLTHPLPTCGGFWNGWTGQGQPPSGYSGSGYSVIFLAFVCIILCPRFRTFVRNPALQSGGASINLRKELNDHTLYTRCFRCASPTDHRNTDPPTLDDYRHKYRDVPAELRVTIPDGPHAGVSD